MPKVHLANVSFRQLEALLWIAQLGSFEAAANRLSTTQSAISKRIRELENACGVDLFVRTSRHAKLTDAGEMAARRAAQLLEARTGLLEDLFPSKKPLVRRIRIGVTAISAETWLSRFAAAVHAAYPSVHLEADVGNSAALCAMLEKGRIDLAVLPQHAAPLQFMQAVLPSPLKFMWMCASGFPMPRGRLSLARIGEFPVILQSRSTSSDVVFGRWLSQQGVHIPNVVYSNSMLGVRSLALAGIGIAYLPVEWCKAHLAQGWLRKVNVQPALPPVTFSIAYNSGNRSPFLDDVIRLIQVHGNFKSLTGERVD
jgi:DNA-binding transcriptional LysR family regulator